MVRSGDHAAFWFITAQVDDSYPATWASNQPKDGSGLIFSMDDNALEISGFGRGEELREPYRFSPYDDGWLESRECSEGN
jgi:hypothetical protein